MRNLWFLSPSRINVYDCILSPLWFLNIKLLQKRRDIELDADNLGYTNLLSQVSFIKVAHYLNQLQTGEKKAGVLLQKALYSREIDALTVLEFIECLLNTKKTQIFAESSVFGDGSDWNLTELGILGDISMAMEVEIFDDGLHRCPNVHSSSFKALLIYIPGALLRNGTGNAPADWEEVTADGQINYKAFFGLYERRIIPCLLYANDIAFAQGVKTIITIPGLGCGQFAGKFKGQLGTKLRQVLHDLLTKYARQLPSVSAIYFDPFDECENERIEVRHISLLVRPLLKGNDGKGQLCYPDNYGETKEEFNTSSLTSLVAWDHVSWPGNDFYIGSRATDDGVKAAATNTMEIMTLYAGEYSVDSHCYQPPNGYHNWGDVVTRNAISLICNTNLKIY